MDELGTYANIFRKLLRWEWFTDSKTVHFLIYCILKANYKPKIWQGINIESGQFITSFATIQAETGLSTQSARTCIKRLISTSTITSEPTSKYTMITLCNYESYQTEKPRANKQANKQANKPTTSDQQTNNKPTTTTNKDKNLNNGNKIKNKEYVPIIEFFKKSIPPTFTITDKQISSWNDTIDKLIRIDKKTLAEIESVIKFARESDFWCDNFLSITKLRKKSKSTGYKYYEMLLTEMNNDRNKTNGTNGSPQHNSYIKTEEQRQKRLDYIESNKLY